MTVKLINVIGASHDSSVFFCNHIANRISETTSIPVEFTPLLELDYIKKIKELCKSEGGKFYSMRNKTHCVYITRNSGIECIGDLNAFIEYAKEKYGLEDAAVANTAQFEASARLISSNLMVETGHAIVYLDFIDGAPIRTAKSPEYGTLIIELFDDLCPKACANFIKLCCGEKQDKCYVNNPIHRLVPGGWFQCGDIVDGSGLNSIGVDKDKFEDESFSVKYNEEQGGIVGYVTSGPHSNGSQFFVTFGACNWMDNNYQAFGRVLQGYDTLRRLEAAPTKNQRPNPSIIVGTCGKQGVVH